MLLSLAELEEDLRLLRDARKDIIEGRVISFGKGDTRYKFLSLEQINAEIRKVSGDIALKKGLHARC